MLEILVSLRRARGEGVIGGSETKNKKVGDIVCAKKSPAVWGDMEKRFFLITYFNDPDLEAYMADKELDVFPFARSDLSNKFQTVERCAFRVDINMFDGTVGLDPTDTTPKPVAPNGKEYLTMRDLILTDPDLKDNTAILLDSGGKKSELCYNLLSPKYNIVDRIVFSHTYEDKMWKHNLDIPANRTVIDVSDICSTVMDDPLPSSQLIDKLMLNIMQHGARYIICGRQTPFFDILRYVLSNNLIMVYPFIGVSTETIEQECANRGILYENVQIEVDGETIIHSRILDSSSSSSSFSELYSASSSHF